MSLSTWDLPLFNVRIVSSTPEVEVLAAGRMATMCGKKGLIFPNHASDLVENFAEPTTVTITAFKDSSQKSCRKLLS